MNFFRKRTCRAVLGPYVVNGDQAKCNLPANHEPEPHMDPGPPIKAKWADRDGGVYVYYFVTKTDGPDEWDETDELEDREYEQ